MRVPRLKTKDLLTVTDLTRDEMLDLFRFAAKLKAQARKKRYIPVLKNRSLAMIFEKSSTRTRVSFETGITQLGGHALFLDGNDIQLGRGETIKDTARVLSRYVDGIMIRTFSHDKVAEFAANSTVPVINGLTDSYHPCQALSDFFTVYEREDDLGSIKFTYVGDGNNVARSLMLAASILGLNFTITCPEQFCPSSGNVETARKLAAGSNATIEITPDLDRAVDGAHYLYTDVWISMGEEKNTEKKKMMLSKYKISRDLLNKCAPGCRVMHCLPAKRGEEIDDEVMDSESSIIFEQAENRLHVEKAIHCALMK